MLGWSCGSGERCRYRQNWLVIEAYCSLIGVSYFISLPSLHQFVTSSDRPEDSDVSLLNTHATNLCQPLINKSATKHHSNPYIESTTILSDTARPSAQTINVAIYSLFILV